MTGLFTFLLPLLAQAPDAAADAAEKAAEAAEKADAVVEKTGEAATWLHKIAEKIGGKNEIVTSILSYSMSVAGALLLLILGFVLAKIIKRIITKAVQKGMRDDGSSPLPKFAGSAVYYTIIIIVVLACLSIFGIETTSFSAIIAAAGLAIGLAFQGTLSNLAAGVMLIVFRPFKLGDYITGGGQSGVVREIKLFTTTIMTLDNRLITIPNSALSSSTIDNCSQEFRRADVAISVPYEADLDSTRAALERAMDVEGALAECPAGKSHVYLLDVTPGAKTNYQVRVWCNGADYWAVRERVTAQCKRELDRNGVTISSQGIRRADVLIGVAYEADLDATRKALEAACQVDGVLPEPAPAVVLCDFGPSSVNYSVRCWCKGCDFWAVKERVSIQVKRELDKADIEIPFPQVTVSHKKTHDMHQLPASLDNHIETSAQTPHQSA
ncbi:MAG: mechanosensitive ion channel [Proteobacteria bacterium]|nr:mechanosensitive ion channel [Pseudomonadota bacterium]